jgi:hypothetical protein
MLTLLLIGISSESRWEGEYDNLQLELREFDPGWSGRTFSISNISLVITYVTLVVAAVMLAGFMWLAFAFSGTGGGHDGYSQRQDDYAYGYSRSERSFEDEEGINSILKSIAINGS